MDVAPKPTEQFTFTFTCFPKLPLELRRKVWNYASFFERDLRVHAIDVFQKPLARRNEQRAPLFFAFKSFARPPALLHTSHEAREEGLHYYQLSFGTEFEIQNDGIHGSLKFEGHIYANFLCDRVWPECELPLSPAYGIRRIAVNEDLDRELLIYQGPTTLEEIYVYPWLYCVKYTEGDIPVAPPTSVNMRPDVCDAITGQETKYRESLRVLERDGDSSLAAITRTMFRYQLHKYKYIKSMRVDFDAIFLERNKWKTSKGHGCPACELYLC